ncbi:hypothetical protein [Leucobacter chironomi]|uniref:hypothetical protein n=1 Tax=Leucobacter chironomi TaxID=491918 RepID=UPI0003F792EA|nr:hypothetical protein [Leucobacter chironomi]
MTPAQGYQASHFIIDEARLLGTARTDHGQPRFGRTSFGRIDATAEQFSSYVLPASDVDGRAAVRTATERLRLDIVAGQLRHA